MPAQPAWFQRLDEILADLRSMTSTRLDRQAVEKLFGVGQRRARQLMAGLDGIRAGNAADRSPPQPSLYMRAPPADGTLEDRLRDGPLAPVQAASVVARLADPLAPCTRRNACTGPSSPAFVRLQDVAGRGSRDRQSHRAVQLHAVDLRGATAHVQWPQRRRQQQHER